MKMFISMLHLVIACSAFTERIPKKVLQDFSLLPTLSTSLRGSKVQQNCAEPSWCEINLKPLSFKPLVLHPNCIGWMTTCICTCKCPESGCVSQDKVIHSRIPTPTKETHPRPSAIVISRSHHHRDMASTTHGMAVLVEPRKHPQLVSIVLNMWANLPKVCNVLCAPSTQHTHFSALYSCGQSESTAATTMKVKDRPILWSVTLNH